MKWYFVAVIYFNHRNLEKGSRNVQFRETPLSYDYTKLFFAQTLTKKAHELQIQFHLQTFENNSFIKFSKYYIYWFTFGENLKTAQSGLCVFQLFKALHKISAKVKTIAFTLGRNFVIIT